MTIIDIAYEIPIKTVSSANRRGGWKSKHFGTTKPQRDAARLWTRKATMGLTPLLRVTMTRVGGRGLDDDNLASAMKAVRDGIADALKIDDGTRLVEWVCCQEPDMKITPSVRVKIERVSN